MNETPATVRMIDGATAPAISNVFVNNACAVCTLQITGSFTAATVLVEGIVNVVSNQWVTLAAFNLSDLSLEKDGADKAGIYQVGIEGILRVRMNVTEVSGGDITIAAQFGNATINQFSETEASNLIPITAYDLAVAGGYTGTLEQFETDMGNSASNATAAANSADDAAFSASEASASATASEAAATNMAPVYSASSTYAVGDYVLYNGGLFRCTTAITTAEAWTAPHWTTVKMGPEVSDLKTQLNLLSDTGNAYIDSPFAQGSVTAISSTDEMTINNQKFRVHNTEVFRHPGMVTFIIEEGYRVYFWYKKPDTTWGYDTWRTGTVKFDATNGLVFVISHYVDGAEITTEADPAVFKSKLKYITEIGDRLDSAETSLAVLNRGQNPIGPYYGDVVQKVYVNGSWNDNPNRISIMFIPAITDKMYLSVNPGYLFAVWECNADKSVKGLLRGLSSDDYAVPANKNIAVTLAKPGDAAISLSEIYNIFASQFLGKTEAYARDETVDAEINAVNAKIIDAFADGKIQLLFTVNQAYINNQFKSNPNRISFAEPVPFKTGDKIELDVASGEKFYLMYFNKVSDTGDINTDYSQIAGSGSGWISADTTFAAPGDVYVFVSAAFSGDTAITADIVKTTATLIKKYASADADELPEYWKTYLTAKVPVISSAMNGVGGKGDSFIFYTDPHWGSRNQKHTPQIIKNLMDNTSLRSVYCGGDVIDSGSGGFTAYAKAFRDITVFTARGNHDQNPNAQDATDIVPDSEYYNMILKPVEYIVNTEGKLYYYRDNISEKIRYIFTDSGSARLEALDAAQIAWMQNALTELEVGWSALVIQHIVFSGSTADVPTLSFAATGTALINAVNAVWSEMQCEFIGIISGHVHRDYSATDATNGYPIIATSCDVGDVGRTAYDPDNAATPGTTDEHIIDVFIIDKSNHTISTIRIGAGNNRTFSYPARS